jgi:hypothetical protein
MIVRKEVQTVVTVKMLKPYYIKTDIHHIHVILAYQYFSIIMNKEIYHFVPIEEKEIVIERKTKKIVNLEDKFGFQKGKDIIYFTMTELISLPDFLIQLYFIVESYCAHDEKNPKNKQTMETVFIVNELERLNTIRLIDKALDERDEKAFYSLVKLL